MTVKLALPTSKKTPHSSSRLGSTGGAPAAPPSATASEPKHSPWGNRDEKRQLPLQQSTITYRNLGRVYRFVERAVAIADA